MIAVKVSQRPGFRVRLASSFFRALDKTRKSREQLVKKKRTLFECQRIWLEITN